MNRTRRIAALTVAGLLVTATGAVALGTGDFRAPTTGTTNTSLDRRLDAVEAWIEKNDTDAPAPTPTPTTGPTAPPAPGETVLRGFVTGYTFADNDPPNSNAIAYENVRPGTGAGGVGTYDNPVTVAMKEADGHKPGEKFYLPNLRRYFIVEDLCAASHSAVNGCTSSFDVWVDGRGFTSTQANNCMNAITGNHRFIKNPNPNYVTVTGTGTVASDCREWGDTAVLK